MLYAGGGLLHERRAFNFVVRLTVEDGHDHVVLLVNDAIDQSHCAGGLFNGAVHGGFHVRKLHWDSQNDVTYIGTSDARIRALEAGGGGDINVFTRDQREVRESSCTRCG